MKKTFIKAFLAILAVGSIGFAAASCSNDDDDLKNRVTVLEGKVKELTTELQNAIVTGATITSATQAEDGTWTLVLSDGNTIEIKPVKNTEPTPGGGSTVTVTETDEAFVITVDGNSYSIPKAENTDVAPAISSVRYIPEYSDGLALVGNKGASVGFLIRPSVDASDFLANAVVSIGDVREPKTRAIQASDFIIDNLKCYGGAIRFDLKGKGVTPGANYVMALSVVYKGVTILSDYFKVKISDDFTYATEALETPVMADGVTLNDIGGGFYKATIPNSALAFINGVNLKDYYKSVPSGNITFDVAPSNLQNSEGQSAYAALSAALSKDGTFKFTTRPGVDFNVSKGNSGFLVYMLADGVVKNKIYWQIEDPIPGLQLTKLADTFGNAPHMEYGYSEALANDDPGQKYLAKGENRIHFAELFANAETMLPLCHDGGVFVKAWADGKMTASLNGEDVFYTDGNNLLLGDYGKAICANSAGLVWYNVQTSILQSNRRNLSEAERDPSVCNGSCSGEIIPGYDGVSVAVLKDTFGITIDGEKGDLVTTSAYQGHAFRLGFGLKLQYSYGEARISSNPLCFLFFNRRVCPSGVVDPSAK